MKIVCDNCATKYSIADEKVRGKVFKIRCKKCSHIIVVRGGDGASAAAEPAADAGFPVDEPAPAPRPAAASLGTGEAVWHLVVDREQIGPLTREEVHAKFRGGEVDLETYAWREGFADWLRLGSIEDFRDLAGDGAAPTEGATRRTDTADLFATAAAAPQDDVPAGGDLFSGHNAPSAPTGEAPVPAAAASDMFSGGGNALFGAPQAQAAAPAQRPARISSPGFSGGGGGGAMAAAEPAAEASSSAKMTGQRNENSVLFSLNNLQALASGSGGAPKQSSSSSSSSSSAEPRPGFANSQTEGSGLIDIRAMAASTLSPGPSGSSSSKSDEPSFAAPPLFSPMAAPILMPAPASGPPKWIWALLGVGVLALIGIVVAVVLLVTKSSAPVVAVGNVTNPAVAPPNPINPANPTPNQPNVATPTNPVAPNPAAVAKPADEVKEEKHHKDHKTGKEPKSGSPTAATPVTAPTTPTAPAATPKGKKKGGDELDDLLNNASPDKPAPAAKHSAPREEAPAADSNLPDQLDKGAIVSGMSKVKAKVADCYVQFKVPGLANVSVTIAKTGRVASATVSGSFSGTPTGSCVERAVKGASFGQFKGGSQTINYPFMLR